jgi:hypothetical protein
MKASGNAATQYGESEKSIISFSHKSGDRTLSYLGGDVLT